MKKLLLLPLLFLVFACFSDEMDENNSLDPLIGYWTGETIYEDGDYVVINSFSLDIKSDGTGLIETVNANNSGDANITSSCILSWRNQYLEGEDLSQKWQYYGFSCDDEEERRVDAGFNQEQEGVMDFYYSDDWGWVTFTKQ